MGNGGGRLGMSRIVDTDPTFVKAIPGSRTDDGSRAADAQPRAALTDDEVETRANDFSDAMVEVAEARARTLPWWKRLGSSTRIDHLRR